MYRQTCICLGQEHSIPNSTGLFRSNTVPKGWLHSNKSIPIDSETKRAPIVVTVEFYSFQCSDRKILGQGYICGAYQDRCTYSGTYIRPHRSSDGISDLCLGPHSRTDRSTDDVL